MSLQICLSLLLSMSASAFADAPAGDLVKPTLNSGSGSSVVSDDPGRATVATGSEGRDKIAKIPTSADDERTARILNHIAAESGWFPKLKISVTNGLVSIQGEVKDAEQLAWLAKTADRLPYVVAVINKASVEQPAVSDLSPAWKEFSRLLTEAKKALPLFLLAAVLLAVFLFISKYIYTGVHSVWGRHVNNPFLLSTVTKITMVPVWAVLFFLILRTAGLSGLATTIIGGTGAIGIVLGFAFKDIAENYLSGLLLAIRSPFTKGDDVTVAGYDGFIQALNMRGTTVLAPDGTLILIPNSLVIQSVIKNRSTNPRTRLNFSVGIGYQENSGRAIDLIYAALKSVDAVLQEPAPLVILADMNQSALMLQVRFWIDGSKSSADKTKSVAIASVKEVLVKNGITIPDTSREVILTERQLMQPDRLPDEHRGTEKNHDEQIKRLGDGLDIMKDNADRTLVKT